MAQSGVNLASLIGSRICHDLISPIGAITNGLELLDMTGSVEGPEMELIADSVGNAGARIRFFRIAYGASSDQMLGRAELVGLLDDLNRSARAKADWAPTEPVTRAEVRMAFLALQCCETALPFGGSVRMDQQGDRWIVTAEAEKLSVDPALWEGLSNPAALKQVTPAQVQFALLPAVAEDAGRRVTVETSDRQLVIRF
ncbi:histidine phosphotransferase [Ruegeria pomeroyi]|jgi:histidine phosphotransferase ChpT|uniref:Histidine phosphotransferase ChpT C-terminal domain-containing protein n=2 Tax=Ruegeria pomeroyi TaxID=89184 RepID=Q5LRY7_RUEPO|nr:histidine phosphotransferase family protein [Ruegeria pomeroyi]AAV95258.1 histidine phosphotransferase [Ruegeria pomeroyi DSS-3]NVK97390.1 histidine phosphotransferase [Ruegeria pomeroyi]NVL00298.1 histidine phosphotransferase [Ruegeria pomeroyi]QWV08830.1 histidine phosphotransferase [Ruegeria pomeroyi]